jgi:hypothetical protein
MNMGIMASAIALTAMGMAVSTESHAQKYYFREKLPEPKVVAVKAPTYDGFWSINGVKIPGSCKAGVREFFYPYVCRTMNGVVEDSRCDPAKKSTAPAGTEACNNECGPLVTSGFRSGNSSAGFALTQTDMTTMMEEARTKCEGATVAATQNAIGCMIQTNTTTGKTSGNVLSDTTKLGAPFEKSGITSFHSLCTRSK